MHGESASPVLFPKYSVFSPPTENNNNIMVKIKNKGLEIMIHETATKDACSILLKTDIQFLDFHINRNHIYSFIYNNSFIICLYQSLLPLATR